MRKNDIIQEKTLFYHYGNSTLQFINNTFFNRNSEVGLIVSFKMSDDLAILIHNSTFEKNSALLGADAIRIDILRTKDYNETLSKYMPWSGIQISKYVFTKNKGYFYTTGIILAICGLEDQLGSNYGDHRLYSSPNQYPSSLNVDYISTFKTVNEVTLNENIAINLNQFLNEREPIYTKLRIKLFRHREYW